MTPFWSEGQRIAVRVDGAVPQGFYWQYEEHPIHDLSIHWRIHTGWWNGHEIWRDYWEVTTRTGLLCVLYHDLLEDVWYLERIYE